MARPADTAAHPARPIVVEAADRRGRHRGGAKNSALKLMVACLLADGRSVLSNVPHISDVDIMAEVLRGLGAEVERLENGDVAVTSPPAGSLVPAAPPELFEKMRASVVVLGLLMARSGAVRMPLPGGDDFGDRPIDFHINGLTAMGADFESSHGEVRGTVPGGRLQGHASSWSTRATRQPTTC